MRPAPRSPERSSRRPEADPGVEIIEHALVLDLLTAADGSVCGATLHVMGEGQRGGVGAVSARAVVLATGGMGQVFEQTTNPRVSTGDGVAVALRAGAEVADLEFVQFHPTVLYLGEQARGQQPLISEAVRGEGAYLVDDDGKRFMVGQHELAELAPRDVVAKAIMRRMRETGARARLAGRPSPGRRAVVAPVPDDPRVLPVLRHRPRDRADPGGSRLPLRQRRRAYGPGRSYVGAVVSTPAARWHAPGFTAPTGWRRTPCSRAWSSLSGSARDLAAIRSLPVRNPSLARVTTMPSACSRAM